MRRAITVCILSMAFVGGVVTAVVVIGRGQGAPSFQIAHPLTPPQAEYTDWTTEQVRDFRSFPLYWVGEEFQDLPLTRIIRFVSRPDALVPEDVVWLFYGTCKPVGDDGVCNFPLTITVTPYCYKQPDTIDDQAKQDPLAKIRGGADAQFISDGLRIWTGAASVKIDGDTADVETAAAEALISPNGMGPQSVTEPLPAIDPDCSAYRFAPHPFNR